MLEQPVRLCPSFDLTEMVRVEECGISLGLESEGREALKKCETVEQYLSR